jgi:hypothetical protein
MYGDQKWVAIAIKKSLIVGWRMKFFGHWQLNLERKDM